MQKPEPQTTDPREVHIRALASLMLDGPVVPEDVEDFLHHREYGLALEALAAEIMKP